MSPVPEENSEDVEIPNKKGGCVKTKLPKIQESSMWCEREETKGKLELEGVAHLKGKLDLPSEVKVWYGICCVEMRKNGDMNIYYGPIV